MGVPLHWIPCVPHETPTFLCECSSTVICKLKIFLLISRWFIQIVVTIVRNLQKSKQIYKISSILATNVITIQIYLMGWVLQWLYQIYKAFGFEVLIVSNEWKCRCIFSAHGFNHMDYTNANLKWASENWINSLLHLNLVSIHGNCLKLVSFPHFDNIFWGWWTVSCRWVRPWHFWCRTCCVSVVLSFVSWSIRCKVISLELCHLQSEVSWTSDHFLGGNIYAFHCKSLYYTQSLFFWLAFPVLAWISRLWLFLIPLLFSVVVDNGELDSRSWQRTWCAGSHSEVGWHCEF